MFTRQAFAGETQVSPTSITAALSSESLLLSATPEHTPTPEDTPASEQTSTPEHTPTPEQTPTPDQAPTSEQNPNPGQVSAIAEAIEYTHLLVKLNPHKARQSVLRNLENHGKVIEKKVLSERMDVYILQVPLSQAEEVIQKLNSSGDFLYVEPNHVVYGQEIIPNDPGWVLQYNMPAIQAPKGWQYSTGSTDITIAIVDSGVDINHPDLAGKIVAGYDFVNNDNDPSDDNGHGTHVAGLAAAIGNNGIGIAGVSWGARIMPVKVLDLNNQGYFSDVAAGIIWATDQGAQVINLSLGGLNPSLVLEEAVNYASKRGVLLVGAAGNWGAPFVFYPAAYPAVIAVSATNSTNERAPFSNYGPEIELAAPGANIYSLNLNSGYITRSGTSMSVPQVSGLAAILLGLPGNSSAFLVRNQMKAAALDLGPPGLDIEYGAGLIQMAAALRLVLAPEPTATFVVGPTNFFEPPAVFTPTPVYFFPRSVSGPLSVPTLTWAQTVQIDIFSATPTPTSIVMPPANGVDITLSLIIAPIERLERSKKDALIMPVCSAVLLFVGVLLLLLAKKMRARQRIS